MTDWEKRAPHQLPPGSTQLLCHAFNLSLAQQLMVAHGLGRGRLWLCWAVLSQENSRFTHILLMCMPEPRGHERKGKVGSEGATKKWPESE